MNAANIFQKCLKNLNIFKKSINKNSIKLNLLDEISNESSKIIDRNTILLLKNSKDLEANLEVNKINELFEKLNSDEIIYNQLLNMKFINVEEYQILSKDEKEFLNKIISDYENKYGINMKIDKNNNEILNLLRNEENLKNEFLEKINSEKNKFSEKLIKEEEEKDNFSERIFNFVFNGENNNTENIVNLLKVRKNYANKLNYPNYFEFSLQNNLMIKNHFTISELENFLFDYNNFIQSKNKNLIKDILNYSDFDEFYNSFFKNKNFYYNNLFKKEIPLNDVLQLLINFSKQYLDLDLKISKNQIEEEKLLSEFSFDVYNGNLKIGKIFIDLSLNDNLPQTMILQAKCKLGIYNNILQLPKLYINLGSILNRKSETFTLSFLSKKK